MTLPHHRHNKRRPYPLMITQLVGDQVQMGAQHGAMTRAAGDWREALAYYPRMPEILIGGDSMAARHALRPLVALGLSRLEKARPAVFRDRSLAYMEALGLPASMARQFQIMDVMQNIINTAGRLGVGPFRAQRVGQSYPGMCSSLVAWGQSTRQGKLLHARNFDFPGVGVWERRPSLVFCTPKHGLRYGFIALRGGDVPAVTSFNEAGLTLTIHTRFHQRVSWSGVTACDLTHEILTKASTLAQAQAILEQRPVASSWGLCISSASEGVARSFETCGNRVVPVSAAAGEEFLAATNRYVSPQMQREEVTLSPSFVRNSDGRYNFLRQRAAKGDLDVPTLQSLLAAHGDDECPGTERASGGVAAQVLSVHSVVIEPEDQRLHMSVGPAPTGPGPWITLDFHWASTPGFQIHSFDDQNLPTHDSPRYGQGAAADAFAALVQSAELASQGDTGPQGGNLLLKAARLMPEDATFQLLAGGECLRRGDVHEALAHFMEGLQHEPSTFFQGQLLLWASRAAQAAADEVVANNLRATLLDLQHPLLAQAQRKATAEQHKPLSKAHLRKLRVQHHLAELSLH